MLIGMAIFGVVLGTISYFVVYYFYEKEKEKKLMKMRHKQSIRKNNFNNNLI